MMFSFPVEVVGTVGTKPDARWSFFKKRNDARTELTTLHRRSMACGGRNDDAESMTHPTAGICGIMRRRTRRERITRPRGTMANRFKWACLELDTWRRLDVYAGQLAPNGHFRGVR